MLRLGEGRELTKQLAAMKANKVRVECICLFLNKMKDSYYFIVLFYSLWKRVKEFSNYAPKIGSPKLEFLLN